MSIALIITILKKLFSIITNKWTYFVLLMIVCALIISYLIVENRKKDKDIIRLNTEVTNLIISNKFYQNEILDREDEIKELNIYNNSLSKINRTIKYIIPKEDLEACESISNDFMETQVK